MFVVAEADGEVLIVDFVVAEGPAFLVQVARVDVAPFLQVLYMFFRQSIARQVAAKTQLGLFADHRYFAIGRGYGNGSGISADVLNEGGENAQFNGGQS